MAGDTGLVSAGLDVIAGLMNARALARAQDPEWIWDRMCTVEQANGEGGFHIGSRTRPDNYPFTDLSPGQGLATAKLTQTRIHRNRTLNQGLRVKVNFWAIRDDLTGQIMESVDQGGSLPVLTERERKVADALLGVSQGTGSANTFATTTSSGTTIGTDGLAVPQIQDGLTFYPWQKGVYGINVNATVVSPENGLAIANYGNCNDTDGYGIADYTAIVRAFQCLSKNRDPFTGLPIPADLTGMQVLIPPAGEIQFKFLLEAYALWQIGNSGFTTTGGTAQQSAYNYLATRKLDIIMSQYWFNRLIDVGVAKVSSNGTYSQQKLTYAVGDTFSTVGSIMSAFYMGRFKEALIYWQRMPYQAVQVPLSSIEHGEQTVIVQDHRERGQAFWHNPRVCWRAWA